MEEERKEQNDFFFFVEGKTKKRLGLQRINYHQELIDKKKINMMIHYQVKNRHGDNRNTKKTLKTSNALVGALKMRLAKVRSCLPLFSVLVF